MRDVLIDFGLPIFILAMLFTLLLTGIDGEVKTLLATTVGWIVKSGVSRVRGR